MVSGGFSRRRTNGKVAIGTSNLGIDRNLEPCMKHVSVFSRDALDNRFHYVTTLRFETIEGFLRR